MRKSKFVAVLLSVVMLVGFTMPLQAEQSVEDIDIPNFEEFIFERFDVVSWDELMYLMSTDQIDSDLVYEYVRMFFPAIRRGVPVCCHWADVTRRAFSNIPLSGGTSNNAHGWLTYCTGCLGIHGATRMSNGQCMLHELRRQCICQIMSGPCPSPSYRCGHSWHIFIQNN